MILNKNNFLGITLSFLLLDLILRGLPSFAGEWFLANSFIDLFFFFKGKDFSNPLCIDRSLVAEVSTLSLDAAFTCLPVDFGAFLDRDRLSNAADNRGKDGMIRGFRLVDLEADFSLTTCNSLAKVCTDKVLELAMEEVDVSDSVCVDKADDTLAVFDESLFGRSCFPLVVLGVFGREDWSSRKKM